ncbi:MAG TPA: hypothetical protein VFV33_22535 [Gemmatimonadaceae bacterium]|nr:hypothetical protein [Gemmatimonadaceae bacterium]
MLLTTGADVAMAAVILGSISGTIITVVKTIANRANARDQLRAGNAPESDLRLQRLEQAIDAIAVEVERMSESQRFTAKVLAERLPSAGKSLPPNPPG